MSPDRIRVAWPDDTPEFYLPVATSASSLAERISRAGRALNTRCARRGLCAGCTVELRSGTFRQNDGTELHGPAEVKACQGDVAPGIAAEIAVPARSVIAHRPQIVSSFQLGVTAAHAPIVPVVPGVSDHGLAIDIGTTTVVVALVDLATGKITAEQSAYNRQIEMGDDVLTRIQFAAAPGHLQMLREAILQRTLHPLITDGCRLARLAPGRIAALTIAGNTTMLHLLTGTDPASIGIAPFRATFTEHRVLTAEELGLDVVNGSTPVHLLPGFSSYVGADLVAGCVSTGLLNRDGPSLLVDVGTNGEILLRHGDALIATATAAGPAFEGGRLLRGTRAIPGAVAHVDLDGGNFPARLEILAGAPLISGLCGSAYVDYLAEARRIGLLLPSGRLNDSAWSGLPEAHRFRNRLGRGVRLQPDDAGSIVTEADVSHLLQAKAAIAAGIVMLLRRAGLAARDIRRVHLAGGFGLHLDVPHAIACGLLPGFAPEQIEVAGNASLGGAWLALVDRSVLPEMTAVSGSAEIVHLNEEPGFEDAFIDQLFLP